MRRLLNWRLGLALVVVLPLAGVAAWFALPAVEAYRARQRVEEQVAALDRAEPGWDLASRVAAINGDNLPDSENAAAAVEAAAKAFPKTNDYWDVWHDYEFEPNERMGDGGLGLLADKFLMDAAPALQALAPVTTRRRVAIRVKVPEDSVSPYSRADDYARQAAFLANQAASRAAEKGDVEAAARHLREAAAMPRAIGPIFSEIPGIVRCGVLTQATRGTERTLGLTTLSDSTLAAIQAEFAESSATNDLLEAAKAERAINFAQWTLFDKTVPGGWTDFATLRDCLLAQSLTLDADEAFIAAAQKSLAEQWPATERAAIDFAIDYGHSPTLAGAQLGLYSWTTAARAILRGRAIAGMATAAIACERHRLRTGRWPAALADIPKDLLTEVPTDPFTAKPIAYAKSPEGVTLTIHIGENTYRRTDPEEPRTITFRLFDPGKRNQP